MNEIYALHATKTEASELIPKLGFDDRHGVDFSLKNCPFGSASYFSAYSSTAFQYISNYGEKNESGVFAMLIARVCLGDVHLCVDYDKSKYEGIHLAPEKSGRSENLAKSHTKHYDSIMAVKRDLKEIAIYNRDQIYCEYVVEYSVENLL